MDVLPALASVGYICGIKISSYMFAGGVLSYLVLIPAIVYFGGESLSVVMDSAGNAIAFNALSREQSGATTFVTSVQVLLRQAVFKPCKIKSLTHPPNYPSILSNYPPPPSSSLLTTNPPPPTILISILLLYIFQHPYHPSNYPLTILQIKNKSHNNILLIHYSSYHLPPTFTFPQSSPPNKTLLLIPIILLPLILPPYFHNNTHPTLYHSTFILLYTHYPPPPSLTYLKLLLLSNPTLL